MRSFLSLNYSSLIGKLSTMTSGVAGMLKGAQGVGGGGGGVFTVPHLRFQPVPLSC